MKISRKAIQTVITLISLVVVVVMILAYKMYNKPHRAVEDEAAIAISAVELFGAFEQDEEAANLKYMDRVLEVTGTVSEVTTNMDGKNVVVLETGNMVFGIRCTMQDSLLTIQNGAAITIRGICNGYLSDVVITSGIVMK